jgi:DNA-binding response OmpR family regulator
MEPMDGVEFTSRIRDKTTSPDPYLPIILLTAFTEVSKVKIARDIGVNEILTKPVSPEALYARLTSIVRQPPPVYRNRVVFRAGSPAQGYAGL